MSPENGYMRFAAPVRSGDRIRTRFTLAGGQVSTTANGITWSKQAPDNQDATLTVTAEGNKITLAMETTIRAEGPVEYGISLLPEAVFTTDSYAQMSVNGKARTMDLHEPFDPLGGVSELRYEQMARTVIVRSDRILAAGCVLPLTQRQFADTQMGTRHRAAVGITEQNDALSIVVSEETGIISVSRHGRIVRRLDEKRLRKILQGFYEPRLQPQKER